MSMFDTTATVHPAFNRAIPQLVALAIVGVFALVAAIVLAVVANNVDVGSDIYFDAGNAALKLGLGAWADIMLLVGVVSLVGAIVVGGALEVGKRVLSALETKPAPSTEDAA